MATSATSLTDSQAKALRIVSKNPDITGRRFAELMWPDSVGHRRPHNCGNRKTAAIGAPMPMVAGSYMSKLVKKGWLTRSRVMPPAYQPYWKITPEGLRVLIAFTVEKKR